MYAPGFMAQFPPSHTHYTYQPYRQHHAVIQPVIQGCSFCAKANNRRDDFGLTHRVRDREGNVTCPFLKINTCMRCYQPGHTAMHCTNPSVDQEILCDSMEQMSMMMDASKYDLETEEECVQRKLSETDKEIRLFRLRLLKADFLMPKECSFCKNGNYEDDYYKTHFVNQCPRLACTKCSYCKAMGHTLRYCKLRQRNEALRNGTPLPPDDDVPPPFPIPSSSNSLELGSSFIFDFERGEILQPDDEMMDTAASTSVAV